MRQSRLACTILALLVTVGCAQPAAAPPIAPTGAATPVPGTAAGTQAGSTSVAPARAGSPVAGPRIERAVLAKDQRNFEAIDPTTTFRPTTKKIHLVGRVVDAARNAKLKAVWHAVEVPDLTGSGVMAERELAVDGSRGFAFEFDARQPLAPGRYAADLFLDGQLAQTLPFSVVAPPVPVLARPETDLPSIAGASQAADPKPTNLEFIVDASGSMADPVRGVAKMDAAREALHALVSALPANRSDINVGLRAYAHRVPVEDKPRSCEDTELLVPMQGVDKNRLRGAIDGLAPNGWTPMAYAVQQAARDFTPGQAQNVLVLVTDGEESCVDDPVAPIRAAVQPAGIVMHVVGFDIGDERARAQLRSMAQATGGTYVDARSADELAAGLQRIATEQVQIVRVQSGAGQLRFEPPQGTYFFQWTIKDTAGKNVVQEYGRDKGQATYQLPAGIFTVEFKPTSSGEGALFRVEIAPGQESVLRLGALKFLVRQEPFSWHIIDQNMERQIADPYGRDLPKDPIVVPPGKYNIDVKVTSGAERTTLAKDVDVKPNSIVEVQF